MQFKTISIIGLGYIGLPTAAVFASRKLKVIGVDVNQHAVDTINRGEIHIVEPDLDMVVHAAVTEGYLKATTTPEPADAFLIAVPTPFKGDNHEPDLSYIEAASKAIAPVLKRGDLVILESTSPVGATEQMAAWLAEARSDLTFPQTHGEASDIRVAHCPERVLPGHVLRELVQNDRVVGGMTAKCSAAACALYKTFVEGECVVTNARTAEMAKLTENSFRDVNIAFANELSIICDKLDINVWELIALANRHPRVSILQPGPGVGGHCIAVDPWFIVSKTPEQARLIRTAREVNEAVSVERSPGVYVRRIHLPRMREGFIGQALSFWRYARKVSRLVSTEEYDLVVATSSRLMTAVLGAWVAYRRKARLYLDIRDIFVENLRVLFPSPVAAPLGWFFGGLERWAIKRADRVNLVSRGFLGYFQPRYPGLTYSHFSNGVDQAFIDCALAVVPGEGARQPLQVLYAGNIGDGQGLHLILPELAERLRGRVHFRVVGAGGRLEALREAVASRALGNIELLPPVAREQLLALYQEADVLFLHLNDFAAFRRVLPSKLFEYAAIGKPIWAGVAGYAADFIACEVRNVGVFRPCEVSGAIEALDTLSMTTTDRSAFIQQYSRARIMDEMAQDILQLLESP